MKKEDIQFSDWQRILIGEVPAEFYLEIIIRVVFVYLLLLISMRIMGKRMASLLNRNELAALVSLAAAIGVPILDPMRGLLPAVIIAGVVIVVQRLVSTRAAHDEKFEALSQDKAHALVEGGVINWANMETTTFSREQLMSRLRTRGLIHLGQVERFYLEANGTLTLVQKHEPTPGLTVLPPWDTSLFAERTEQTPGRVCNHCGYAKTYEPDYPEACGNCGRDAWSPAVLAK